MRGLHHLHLRKRAHTSFEPYPARSGWKRKLDRIVLFTGILGPLASVPQVLKIYIFQETSGISILSWGLWALLDIPWIIYGFVHRERPILLTYTLWLGVNISVCVGVVLFEAGAY